MVAGSCLYAQQTAIYDSPDSDYRSAIDLFNKEKYGAAQKQFAKVYAMKAPNSIEKANALYYMGVCSGLLMNKDAESLLSQFIDTYPENQNVESAKLALGNYYYTNKAYAKAYKMYADIHEKNVPAERQIEYKFKKAYCSFVGENYTEAKPLFAEVKSSNTIYKPAATYYYAHIVYTENNYEVALQGFESLKNDSKFGAIVPYYITQIYYKQGKNEELIEKTPALYAKANEKRRGEIARMLGEAYYNLERYEEAIPYLQEYIAAPTAPLTAADYYAVGYALYRTNHYAEAIEYLQKATGEKTQLAQSAYYHIGDCQLKQGNKPFASTGFLAAYEIPVEQEIREDALFNYAKLQYELSSNPFLSAIQALEKYVNAYPNAKHIDEANTYLTNIYLTTKNYTQALASLEKLKYKDQRLLTAYQRIAHYRGLQLFNDQKYSQAIQMFELSQKNNYDNRIQFENIYWEAEAQYRLGKYAESENLYSRYIGMASPINDLAYYNRGYAYYKQKNYARAATDFEKYVSKQPNYENISCDAFIRLGDCYYMKRNYSAAIDRYNTAIKLNKIDGDYATYQKAMALGVMSKFEEKYRTLQSILDNYSKSHYTDDAVFEMAQTDIVLGRNSDALVQYQKLISDYPQSNYVRKAMLNLGLLYYNIDNTTAAMSTLKQVVEKYPGTEESKDALMSIRNIYVDNSNVDEFFTYVKSVSFANVSSIEQDSLTYRAAENKYFANNFDAAEKGFASYLDKFPNGLFVLNANFYKAECNFSKQQTDEALKGYEFVIGQNNSDFLETSLLKAADIYFNKKEFEKAISCYTRLQEVATNQVTATGAVLGNMRACYLSQHYKEAIPYAEKILATEGTSDEIKNEAHMIIAKSAYSINDLDLAEKYFALLKNNQSELGVEATYMLAEIELKKGHLETAEKKIFEILSDAPAYEYWLAKTYILLGDVYLQKDNAFQAKHTYQSIVDNYEGEDLVEIARKKIEAITATEQAALEEEQKKIEERNAPDELEDLSDEPVDEEVAPEL